MREIRTSGSTRGGWVVLMSDIAHSPTLLSWWQETHYGSGHGRIGTRSRSYE